MWKSMVDDAPKDSGWILISTNLGVGIAYFNQPMNEIGSLSIAGNRQSSNTKFLHWATLPKAPEGDFDPDAGGMQRRVM